jgi:acyl transferase domain-containing protein/acyl carrier protein
MTMPIGTLLPAADVAQLTPLKRAFLALEDTQSRLAAMEQAAREPIAVIGVGCRVPGGANNPAGFWRLMRDGVDAIGPIPSDRWDANALYDPDPETPGRIATRCGGFLHTIDQFDPSFFNISPREAMGIDPQQRLLLEVSWEALEHAGQAPDRLERSPTGVYMGACSSDYTYLQLKTRDSTLLDAHFTSGIAQSVISGRVSYVLGLQGPSVTIDTACSSSLVAVHLACNALRSGECRMALAGGVNLILAPDLFIALSRSRMLAPDGRCKTFDAAGDGFARGEGCGVIVLKRLSDAQADGDRILALIRGSAVNQDGPSSSLTAPNGPAQEAVIREALSRAGVAPREVGFVEAHGTGTQLGDPLEINALGAVFATDRDPARPLFIGSVKTNIGHLESAAGVAGLIKVILALQHRTIPPHLHFHTPNPHIAWADLPLQVSTKEIDWEPIGGRRICGVSSFGVSGTNAHIVLEEAPPCVAAAETPVRRSCLLAVSARDDNAFVELASRFADALEGRSDNELADVCYTANAGRAHFTHRGTVIGRTIGELRAGLNALARAEDAMGVRTGRITRRDPPRIAFLFTGQGAQYAGMSQGLYDVAPVFRTALERCAELLAPHLERPLLEVLFPARGQPTPIDETAYTQPALFAVEYALTELWRSWGVTPNIVMGHSVGEYVAACVAGVLSLEDALRLIVQRGRLMQSLPPGGTMAAIFAAEVRVAEAVAPYAAYLSIAAINGPEQTVISGRASEVEAVCQRFTAEGIRCQPLPVSHAFHSPLVDPILDRFEKGAGAVRFAAPRMRFISNVTGRLAEVSEVTRPGYWRRHVREAVRFGDGLRTLATFQPEIVIEIGPNPTLLAFAGSAFDEIAPLLVPSLRKGRSNWEQMLEGLAAIYCAGTQVDLRGVGDGTSRRIVDLPTYPFQRQRYWFQTRSEVAPLDRASSRPTGHPLLGSRLRCAASEVIYEMRISSDVPSFIQHHRVLDHVVLPATAYLDMLVASAHEVLGADIVCVEDVTIREAMLFPDRKAALVVQTVCGPASDGVVRASINSVTEGADTNAWVRHVTANLRIGNRPSANDSTLQQLRERCTEAVAPEEFYAGFARRGVDFGSDFQVIRQLWRGEAQAFGEVALASEIEMDASLYRMHPLLLDGCLQVTAAALPAVGDDVLYLPIGIDRFTLYRWPGVRCWSHVTVTSAAETCRADVRIFDTEGAMVADLSGVQFKRARRKVLEQLGERWLNDCLYESRWLPALLSDAKASAEVVRNAPQDWLIFADEGGIATGLAVRLQAKGDRCILVRPGRFTADEQAPSIDPTSITDYRRLLAELHLAGRDVRGVVHAWSLDTAPWDGMSAADLAEARDRGAVSALLVAQALVDENPVPRLWIVTRGAQQADTLDGTLSPAQAPVWGLGNALTMEHPELQCVCVDLDTGTGLADLDALAAEIKGPGAESQVALRAGERRVARLARLRHGHDEIPLGTPWRLVPESPGSLDQFRRDPVERRVPGPGEVEIAVQATGVNFRDVLSVLGLYPGDPGPLGGECAGRVTAIGEGVMHVRPGDEVLAVAGGSFASHVVTRAELVQPRPSNISAEEGASFPIAFLTAEFCLSHMAGMRKGDRVLIHAAAGGVGMAAVKLAQRAGAEVFATAGTAWKRELLHSMGVTHVFDSRSAAFADEIMVLTNGRGVDVVLNSLSGELIEPSFRVLTRGGRFVEIGKRGIKDHDWVAALNRDLRYFIVDWGETAASDPKLIGNMFARLVGELREGTLAALPRHIFKIEEAERAFRLMAQARHAGKIVVRNGQATHTVIRRDGTYLVTGGLSGLGLSVAHWLGQQGAGRLVLVGRRSLTPEAEARLDELRAGGTVVIAKAVDVSDAGALGGLLELIRKDGPPLRGVVHSAGVLDDGVLSQQDADRFARVFAPKVNGGWLLDRLTRCDPLDWFVMFSSVAAILGSAGQTNYSAANAFLDLLARERSNRGLPGLSINWGAWTGVGVAADRDLIDRLAAQGLGAITSSQGLVAMERLIENGVAQAAVVLADWRRFVDHLGGISQHSFLADVVEGTSSAPTRTSVAKPHAADLRDQLDAAPTARRRSIVAAFVREGALRALGLDPIRALDSNTPLGELGLDSLLAVELRNAIGRGVGVNLSATLLFDYPTVETLTNYLCKEVLKLTTADEEDSGARVLADARTGSAVLAGITELSDEEVEHLLDGK